jgi:hypothetical protein
MTQYRIDKARRKLPVHVETVVCAQCQTPFTYEHVTARRMKCDQCVKANAKAALHRYRVKREVRTCLCGVVYVPNRSTSHSCPKCMSEQYYRRMAGKVPAIVNTKEK